LEDGTTLREAKIYDATCRMCKLVSSNTNHAQIKDYQINMQTSVSLVDTKKD